MESAQLYKLSVSPVSSEPASEAADAIHTRSLSENDARKRAIREHFDLYAGQRPWWEQKATAYIDDQIRYFRFLIPEGLRVLEIGSGLGTLLAAVKPARGVGIDLSPEMVKEAAQRHPTLDFRVGDAESLELHETFDVIILSDLIGHLVDVQVALGRLRHACTPHTRIIVSSYNFLWEPLLRLGEKIGMKMPQPEQSWFSPADISHLLSLADFDTVKVERRLLVPKRIPLLSSLCNNLLAYVPGFRRLCLSHYIVARPRLRISERPYSTTIVVPCRNERGNIESTLRRIPRFGGRQQIIFVDGHSDDGTPEEIRRLMATYPGKDIKLLIQDGKGKGDAVRKGFAHATGDVLMILDADLTVPPEALPKFYEAIANGKGELITGCRLVYPMESQAMRLFNLVGNKFFGQAFSWLLNQRIKDTLCGTKVLFRHAYERIAANRHYFGDFDPFGDFDLLFGASKLNLQIIEIPIRYQARAYGTTNIQRFRHGWLLLKMTVYAFFRLKAV